jgi:hypothetical protein
MDSSVFIGFAVCFGLAALVILWGFSYELSARYIMTWIQGRHHGQYSFFTKKAAYKYYIKELRDIKGVTNVSLFSNYKEVARYKSSGLDCSSLEMPRGWFERLIDWFMVPIAPKLPDPAPPIPPDNSRYLPPVTPIKEPEPDTQWQQNQLNNLITQRDQLNKKIEKLINELLDINKRIEYKSRNLGIQETIQEQKVPTP